MADNLTKSTGNDQGQGQGGLVSSVTGAVKKTVDEVGNVAGKTVHGLGNVAEQTTKGVAHTAGELLGGRQQQQQEEVPQGEIQGQVQGVQEQQKNI
ncbi:hypothetical protein B7463_g3026, partial [Scytalidium lignicola]